MDITGTLYNWNDDKGFGFVKPDNGDHEVFVHITSFGASTQRPKDGDLLIYEIKKKDGKSAAINVRFANGQKVDALGLDAFKQRPLGSFIIGGLCLYSIIYHMTHFPLGLVFPIIISVITYFVYSMDKAAARAEKQRTSEKFLHFLSLIGGWPGAFIAQTRLRHKLRKSSFMIVYWLTVSLSFAYPFMRALLLNS